MAQLRSSDGTAGSDADLSSVTGELLIERSSSLASLGPRSARHSCSIQRAHVDLALRPPSARAAREVRPVSLDDRKLEVLRAIVEDYVATQEPVGSKALVERHDLGVSPATVRNDMAALEEEGYIAQPHTSAGRIPTDKGYRLFVDRLTTVKPLIAGREPRDRRPSSTARSTSTTWCSRIGAAARAADPPGRDRAVPVADPLRRSGTSSWSRWPRPGCWSC